MKKYTLILIAILFVGHLAYADALYLTDPGCKQADGSPLQFSQNSGSNCGWPQQILSDYYAKKLADAKQKANTQSSQPVKPALASGVTRETTPTNVSNANVQVYTTPAPVENPVATVDTNPLQSQVNSLKFWLGIVIGFLFVEMIFCVVLAIKNLRRR